MCVPGWLAGWLTGCPYFWTPQGAGTGWEGMEVDASVYLEVFPDVEVAVSPGQGYSTQDRDLQKGGES